jgi:hypothetical protein
MDKKHTLNPTRTKIGFLEVDASLDADEPSLTLWPRFLVIQDTNKDIQLAKLNPFAIEKGLKGSAGTPTSVRRVDLETSLLRYPKIAIQTVCCVPQCWQIVR